jgi:hypothetical protein
MQFKNIKNKTMRNRYLFFMSALVSIVSLIPTLPAYSYMLQGTIEKNASFSRGKNTLLPLKTQPVKKLCAASGTTDYGNQRKQQLRAELLQGIWQCVTKVTGSTAPGVLPGTIVECEVQYVRRPDGTLIEKWHQDGWMPSANSVVRLDTALMTVNHNSVFASRGGQTWSAQSEDTMQLVAPDTILAEGLVSQYINGRFVGHYQTSSVLRKAS